MNIYQSVCHFCHRPARGISYGAETHSVGYLEQTFYFVQCECSARGPLARTQEDALIKFKGFDTDIPGGV